MLEPLTLLPDGQISRSAVQPHFQKYFHSRLTQITSISLAVSSPRGALAIVTDAGWDAVDAAASARDVIAGQASACERSNGEQTNDDSCGRQSRVVLAPVAGVKLAEARRPDRDPTTLNPPMTVTRRIRRRGEHEISR